MSTLGDLVTETRGPLRDTGPNALVQDEHLVAFLNQAQEDLALRYEMDEYTVTGTTGGIPASPEVLGLPPGATDAPLVELISLDLGTDDHVLIVSIDEFNRYQENASSPSDTIAYIYDGAVTMYPTPVVGTAYTMRYRGLPARMVESDDEWALPRWTERKGIAFARWQASLMEDRPAIADRYQYEYEQDLPRVPLGRAAKFPGPLRIRIQAGAFDRDVQNRHLGRAT